MRANNLFAESYKAGYAQNHSTLHQDLLIGEYIIGVFIKGFFILLFALISGILLFLLHNYPWASIVLLGLSSILLTILLRKLIEEIKLFRNVTHIVYGDDYYKMEKALISQFWKLKSRGMKDDDIFKSLDTLVNNNQERNSGEE